MSTDKVKACFCQGWLYAVGNNSNVARFSPFTKVTIFDVNLFVEFAAGATTALVELH